jgi:hypothetical protein
VALDGFLYSVADSYKVTAFRVIPEENLIRTVHPFEFTSRTLMDEALSRKLLKRTPSGGIVLTKSGRARAERYLNSFR